MIWSARCKDIVLLHGSARVAELELMRVTQTAPENAGNAEQQ
jgi:hypothetical protein